MSRSGHSLSVSPSLTVICFRRPGSRLGPLFVVREWDAKVIRVSKLSKAHKSKGMSTEQALRANVRQAILNMNLHLEPANKMEIQYLKSVGILGKRAPSCSLLYAKDLLRLLLAFDRKRVAEDLKHALGDESNFALEDDPNRVIPRILIRSQHSQLNPVELHAYPKTPLHAEQYSIRQVEVSISKITSVAIAKLLRANNGAAPRRLLMPDESGAAAAAPAPSRSGKGKGSKSAAAGGGAGSKRKSTSALDALLSVLGDAKHGDLDEDEEMAQAHAAEEEHMRAQQQQEDEEEEAEEEDEGAAEHERGDQARAAAASHYNGSARSYDQEHSKRRKRSHVVPALAAAVAAAASSSDEYSSPALGFGRRESGSHVPVSSPPSLIPASMDSPVPSSSEFAVPAARVRGHHHHHASGSGSGSGGGGGLPAALVLPSSPDRSLAPSPAASLFRSTLLSPLLPSSSVPSPSPSPSPPLPSTPSELINSLRASLSVEEARKIASLFAAKASEAAAAQATSRPQSRASVSTAGGSGGGGPASVSAVASAAAAAVTDSLLLSVDTPRSFATPELLSPSIMRRLLSPSSASYTIHPAFPGVLPMPAAATSSSVSAAASSTPLGSPPLLRSSSQPSTDGDGDSPEPASMLSAAAAAAAASSSARLLSRRADRPQSLSSVPPSPGSMHPPPLPIQSPTPAPFAMSDGGAGIGSSGGANEAAPVPFSMPLGAFAADVDSAF